MSIYCNSLRFRRKLKLVEKSKVPIDEGGEVWLADHSKDVTLIAASSSSADACRQQMKKGKVTDLKEIAHGIEMTPCLRCE